MEFIESERGNQKLNIKLKKSFTEVGKFMYDSFICKMGGITHMVVCIVDSKLGNGIYIFVYTCILSAFTWCSNINSLT